MNLYDLLNNNLENNILPFFWQHHEDEETLRKYMQIINEANIGAVCIESRPHPGFLEETWWSDLDVIFDEAKKRNMKVWILDDSHFPSGFSNGALKGKYPELHRQFVTYKKLDTLDKGIFTIKEEYKITPPFEKSMIENFMMGDCEIFNDDECLGFVGKDEEGKCFIIKDNNYINKITDIYGLYKTRNRGPHRDYINMCDKKAVRLFIDTVYEEHYKHYKDYFGNVLEGFFSDEPELGNGHLYSSGKKFFEMEDIPYSDEIDDKLKNSWKEDFLNNLLIMFIGDKDMNKTTKVRTDYMDILTNTVKEDFSYQIGDWCRERNVKYIGHLIEDHNQHTRTGSSLGHYFRGLKGQSWAGIDDIGGQVIPQMEDAVIKSNFSGAVRDGSFFHYTLGKLGSSAAAIDPIKKGNSMCEIFGAYGWKEGVYLEKYLIDHFMVRGINHFVPHAFSPKAFPDEDCPPHFYAHGHNPQYRHFGELMKYTNRICNLISNGKAIRKVAVLYHAEADWSGLDYQKEDELTKYLTEHQIDFDIIPSDIFIDDEYNYEINGSRLIASLGEYDVVIIPEYPVIRDECVNALNSFTDNGGKVVCINKKCSDSLKCRTVSMDELNGELNVAIEISFNPGNRYLRYIHYVNNYDCYYFVNEDNDTYKGKLTMPLLDNPLIYDAWNNKLYPLNYIVKDNRMEIEAEIEPRKSLIIYSDGSQYETEKSTKEEIAECQDVVELKNFKRSVCLGIDYPVFKDTKEVAVPDVVHDEYPDFGGYIKYETIFNTNKNKAYLKIEEPLEGIEVFVNGISAGIQIVPDYIFDLSDNLKGGENKLEVIIATTLERYVKPKSKVLGKPAPEPENKLGISKPFKLYY